VLPPSLPSIRHRFYDLPDRHVDVKRYFRVLFLHTLKILFCLRLYSHKRIQLEERPILLFPDQQCELLQCMSEHICLCEFTAEMTVLLRVDERNNKDIADRDAFLKAFQMNPNEDNG
jgi:hypothetical protein